MGCFEMRALNKPDSGEVNSDELMITAISLRIDEEFMRLIPPLSTEEYIQLEENLIENGIREPISTWGDVIIDGHNRYEISIKHNLQYFMSLPHVRM